MTALQKLAQGLEELREAKGWTQQKAADAVGVSLYTWNRWANGHGKPRQAALGKIAEVFEIDSKRLAEIFGDADVRDKVVKSVERASAAADYAVTVGKWRIRPLPGGGLELSDGKSRFTAA